MIPKTGLILNDICVMCLMSLFARLNIQKHVSVLHVIVCIFIEHYFS